MIALILAVSVAASCNDALRGIGRFDSWRGNDAAGWSRSSEGNGVTRAVHTPTREGYSAGFQTYYGPGSLETEVYLRRVHYELRAMVGGGQADGQVGVVSIRVQDLTSERYLDASGAWVDGPADAVTHDHVGDFRAKVVPFDAEAPGRTLRVAVYSSDFGGPANCGPSLCPTGWVDDLLVCPTRP